MLNNKMVTGEMLLELAFAYTSAINEGSVPNIQNAWSYVCQNECNRAISESLSVYSNEMDPFFEEAKSQMNQSFLKKGHFGARERAILLFKQKALGQDTVNYERNLMEGISKSH